MKKYTKEITALLTLITAGVIGGSIYAAVNSRSRTAGDTVINESEEPDRLTGDAMDVTSCSDNYCEETEITSTTEETITPDITSVK